MSRVSRAYYDPFYREQIPTRPTPPDPGRMTWGPTEQFRRLELQRLAWAMTDTAEPYPSESEAGRVEATG